MELRGVDVSGYQKEINWGKVAESGVDFAILKIIRKDMAPDKQFEANWSGATEAGIPVQGVYNYSYATTIEKFISDAKRVVEILNGRKAMVWLDIEDKCLKGVDHETLFTGIKSYGEVIINAGLDFGVYTGLAFYKSYIASFASELSCPFWIARYPSTMQMSLMGSPNADKKPVIKHALYGWQYTSKGVIPGIKGNVDLNELYVAVDTPNVMPKPEATIHKVGEEITVSSYYKASTDPISKAIYKNASGRIIRVKAGTANPYCFGNKGVAIGWCNDGDIRSASEVKPESKIHVVKRGETLSKIAKLYGKNVADIQKVNGISNPNRIYVNQKIKIQ